jgi:hypothetical protein
MDIEKLKELNACKEATDWCAENKFTTIEEAWEKCERGDWMLWLYRKLYPNNLRELTLAKGHCANTVRHLMTDPRSINVVDAAIAFGAGKISKVELRASTAAYAASAADVAAYAAAYTASTAASTAAYAASAAADAAYAVYADYADAASTAVLAEKLNQRLTADICRQYLKLKEGE